VPPRAKGGRNPGGRFPRPVGRFPRPGSRFPKPGGRFPRPRAQPGGFPGKPTGGVPGGARPGGAPPGGTPPGGMSPTLFFDNNSLVSRNQVMILKIKQYSLILTMSVQTCQG